MEDKEEVLRKSLWLVWTSHKPVSYIVSFIFRKPFIDLQAIVFQKDRVRFPIVFIVKSNNYYISDRPLFLSLFFEYFYFLSSLILILYKIFYLVLYFVNLTCQKCHF